MKWIVFGIRSAHSNGGIAHGGKPAAHSTKALTEIGQKDSHLKRVASSKSGVKRVKLFNIEHLQTEKNVYLDNGNLLNLRRIRHSINELCG